MRAEGQRWGEATLRGALRSAQVRSVQARALRLAVALACALSPQPAWAEELRTLGELEALCAFSAPLEGDAPQVSGALPGGALLADPLLLSAGRRSYLTERVARQFAVYTVQVPTRGLSLAPSPQAEDARAGVSPDDHAGVSLAGDTPLALPQGPFALSLEGPPLTFDSLTPEAVERLLLAHRAGLLTLEVDFGLGGDLHDRYCEGDSHQRLVRGVALQARLRHVGSQEVAASTETIAGITRRARFAPEAAITSTDALSLRPRVEVTRLECLDAPPPTDDPTDDPTACLPTLAAQWLQDEVELLLLTCYADALLAHGRTQGALSLRLDLQAGGDLTRPQVSIDALASPSISTCALTTLTHLTLPAPFTSPPPPPDDADTPPAPPRSLGLVVLFKPSKR